MLLLLVQYKNSRISFVWMTCLYIGLSYFKNSRMNKICYHLKCLNWKRFACVIITVWWLRTLTWGFPWSTRCLFFLGNIMQCSIQNTPTYSGKVPFQTSMSTGYSGFGRWFLLPGILSVLDKKVTYYTLLCLGNQAEKPHNCMNI